VDIKIYQAIERWSDELSGVFTMADLRVVLGDRTEAALYKRLAGLVREGVLVKVKRGIYAVPGASLAEIGHRIAPEAYVSTGTVLARHGLIGSVPARRLQAVKTGRPRTYRCALGTIEHLSIAPHLYFGFGVEDGIRVATPEKAFLDTCYYRWRGKTFSFDPAADVAVEDLDRALLEEYLARYDKRFADHFNRMYLGKEEVAAP
jgi:predicted transcriptional regulator of viral defense system